MAWELQFAGMTAGYPTTPAELHPAELTEERPRRTAVARGFETEPLRDMVAVGKVTASSARLWMRSDRPGKVSVEYWPSQTIGQMRRAEFDTVADGDADGTRTVVVPPRGEPDLDAGVRYAYRCTSSDDGSVIGSGSFETAPADAASAPDYFSIAFMSCNQPFDESGGPSAGGAAMLDAAQRCLEDHSAKLVLTLGDQMYTDYPSQLSLFDRDYFESLRPRPIGRRIEQCSAAEVRRLLDERYRYFWNFEGWRRMHASYPCYPILDDHEMVDNWGSVPEHSNAAWADFREGARHAYYDYQGSRVGGSTSVPEDFDYDVEYGPIGIYVMDLRSNRRTGDESRVYARAQLEKLREFLGRNADKDVLAIALSVPPVHLPRWAARVSHAVTLQRNEDFSDRWSTAGHLRDRNRLLAVLHDHSREHPSQRIVLLSGDIHIACAHELRWDDDTRPMLQLISSGITHEADAVTQAASKLAILANRRVDLDEYGVGADVRLLQADDKGATNPFTQRNVGLLELRRDQTGRFAVRCVLYGHNDGAPVRAYRSVWC